MKITEYQKVKAIEAENVFLMDGENGTKIIEAQDLSKNLESLSESAAVAKSIPGDDDTIPLFDSDANAERKKIPWGSLVTSLKTGFDSVFAAKNHTHNPGDIGAVPKTRTINMKPLDDDISLSPADVGALPAGGTAVAASKLEVARTLRIDLASESAASFDGTAPVEPGVKGILLPPHGGIGSATEMHRMIFRGKNLGTALTAAQKAAIQNGTFDDLWLGDYWVINGVNWRIVDMDYWWNCGNTAFTKHHLVIMPDTNLGANKQMNTTNTTEGGYVGSLMYTTNMADAKAMCTGAFGANILSHREYLVNAVANGKPSAGAWMDSSIELPNECMIYGHPHFTPACDGTTVPTLYTIDKTQLALFAAVPKFIVTRQNYWLRDIVSSACFAGVYYDGTANAYNASVTSVGVRPVFPVGVS